MPPVARHSSAPPALLRWSPQASSRSRSPRERNACPCRSNADPLDRSLRYKQSHVLLPPFPNRPSFLAVSRWSKRNSRPRCFLPSSFYPTCILAIGPNPSPTTTTRTIIRTRRIRTTSAYGAPPSMLPGKGEAIGKKPQQQNSFHPIQAYRHPTAASPKGYGRIQRTWAKFETRF